MGEKELHGGRLTIPRICARTQVMKTLSRGAQFLVVRQSLSRSEFHFLHHHSSLYIQMMVKKKMKSKDCCVSMRAVSLCDRLSVAARPMLTHTISTISIFNLDRTSVNI